MYPKLELPSYKGFPEFNSHRIVLDYLELSKEYKRGKYTFGAKEEELQWSFDKLFALVESTKLFFWLYQVVLGKVNEKKQTENHGVSKMYPKSEFPSYEGLPEINSLHDIFKYLYISKEYKRRKDTDGVRKKDLNLLFDNLFALVESTKSFICMYQVV